MTLRTSNIVRTSGLSVLLAPYLGAFADSGAVFGSEFHLPSFICVLQQGVSTHAPKLVLKTIKGSVVAWPEIQTCLEGKFVGLNHHRCIRN